MSETLPRSVFELFQASNCGIMDSHVICDHCGYVSKTDGHVVGAVSVPLQPRIDSGNLSMYLEKYMDEIVTGYKCDRCKNTSDKHRLQKITHSPDVLLIQLKRFDWRGKKDSEPVRFSSTLNLNPYRDEANKVDSEYELSAVVVHAGSINSGHYICLAKGPDGVWMEFNDLSVSKSSLNAVLDLGTGGGRSKKDNGGWTPYLLFFQRKMK
jgi:ubiquitin C-terminal hydrolase